MIIHLKKQNTMLTRCGLSLVGQDRIAVTERPYDCNCEQCKVD